MLNARIRISNGPPPGDFDPVSSLEKFMETKMRRTVQSKRKQYKKRTKEKQVETLMDIEYTEDDQSSDSDDEPIDTAFDNAMEYEE